MFVAVEDEPDVRFLIRMVFRNDPDFELVGEVGSAEGAIELLQEVGSTVGLIILDHALEGELTGLEAAPKLKALAPGAKIILFTAHEHLRAEAAVEPAIDAFLLKTDTKALVPLARRLVGLPPRPS